MSGVTNRSGRGEGVLPQHTIFGGLGDGYKEGTWTGTGSISHDTLMISHES